MIDKDLEILIKDFFLSKRSELLSKYINSSRLGNKANAMVSLKEILKFLSYHDRIIYLLESGLDYTDELIACLESCNLDLKKLRLFLEDLRGVSIDIIETNLIVY